MKPTIEEVMHHYMNNLQVKVKLSAYSESKPGWSEMNAEYDYYRLVYFTEGKGQVVFKDHSFPVKEGRMFFIPLRLTKTYRVDSDASFARYWCNFQIGHGDIHLVESMKLPLYIDVRDQSVVLELFSRLVKLQHAQLLTRELRQKAALLELLAFYIDESNVDKEESYETDIGHKWNDVLHYIEQSLHTNIAVEKLAKLAYLHPNYFITAFRDMMGCSPIQYVTNRRIAAAKQLLADSELSISVIAGKVGMQNHYLSRLFKRYTGVTPNEYRRIMRDKTGIKPTKADLRLGSEVME